MNLVALNIDTIPLGQPLPFALRGAQGVLLAHKGYVIRNRAELEVLLARGYVVDKVQCVDMFPNTYHVETVVGLHRKDM